MEMLQVLQMLLSEHGYIKRDLANMRAVDLYTNTTKSDHIVLADYSAEDLINFDASEKTSEVVKLFKEFEEERDLTKNTSLVIFVETSNIDDSKILKNAILKVEENPFAFRKFVITYQQEALEAFNDLEDIGDYLNQAVQNDSEFDVFQAGNSSSLYPLIMQLFIKLPFMSVRGTGSAALQEFINPAEKSEHADIIRAVDATGAIISNEYEDIDDIINRLLTDDSIVPIVEEGIA